MMKYYNTLAGVGYALLELSPVAPHRPLQYMHSQANKNCMK